MYRITDISDRNLYTDLLREFINRKHIVFVATPSERRYKESAILKKGPGFEILPIRTLNLQKTNFIEKGLGIILLEYQFKRQIEKHWKNIKFDLILYSTPPITFNKVVKWQKSKGAISYLMLKDIFPQNAVDLGLIKQGGFLWKFFNKKEKRLYALSDYIGCMSPANCNYLLANNISIPSNKVEVCPNSIELSVAGNIHETIEGIGLKFENDYPICIYGGNIGKPQGVDFILKVLDAVKAEKINFCIIGSGTESHKLQKWIEENPDCRNVKIIKQLPKNEFDLLVASADIGLIFLDSKFTIPNFPSRLLSLLENRLPVLLATDTATDIGTISEKAGFGMWSESGDIDSYMINLKKLAENAELRGKMGEKGYQFLKDNYTVGKTADVILSHFE